MKAVEKYFQEEQGYSTYYDDNSFCVYDISDDEFFIAHFYVGNRRRSYEFFNKIKDLARQKGCTYLSGNIDMNESNYNRYTEKLLIHLKHGYKVVKVTENRITVAYLL